MTLSAPLPDHQEQMPYLKRIWYRHVPTHLFGEVLSKPWIDTAVPVVLLLIVLALFSYLIPGFFAASSLTSVGRLGGEYLLVGIGQAVVIVAGGIDLSIGSIFAVCNLVALFLVFNLKIHVALALPLTMLVGAAIGSVNGFFIGYLRLRAFLTTLVTLIILRAVVNIVSTNYGELLGADYDANGIDLLDFLGDGSFFGIPSSLAAALLVAIVIHFMLTRTRLGWHMMAVGGSRRAAFNAGIRVRRVVFLTYVFSGAMTAAAAYFYAARLTAVGFSTGLGMELIIVTGAVLGGISLGGGRGSIAKAVIGTLIVVIITSGMLRMNLAIGGSSMVLGIILLFAVTFDIRWNKNRHKVLNRAYVSPKLMELPERPSIEAGSIYAHNDRFSGATAVGLGIEGPEDIVIDDEGNMFCGSRTGDVYRLFGPDFQRRELFMHTGGRPLGMQVDRDGSIIACIAGMGLYRLTKNREAIALSVRTNRSLSIIDDSRVKVADDVDIAPDGKMYYSDPTTRYESAEWVVDALEGRGNGRVLCYDPADGSTRTIQSDLVFSNGVCVTHDCQSILVAETFAARIMRHWIAGPKKGTSEPFMTNLPGYPDNINRSSDGNYWVAMVGMRSPAFDLALRMPDFRNRMIRRVAPDNWLFPNMNAGCVVKLSDSGAVLDVLWDAADGAHPQVTSMREHKGRLYLAGINSDRIGVLDLPGADPEWTGFGSYWGTRP